MKNISILTILLVLNSCGQGEIIQGSKGNEGQSCHAENVANGVNIICGDETHFVNNGIDGKNGNDGSFQGYIEYRTVCPNVNGQYKESLLYLDGQYMAFLSDSNYKKQRLVILSEGKMYKTTDNRNVSFTIINGEINCI